METAISTRLLYPRQSPASASHRLISRQAFRTSVRATLHAHRSASTSAGGRPPASVGRGAHLKRAHHAPGLRPRSPFLYDGGAKNRAQLEPRVPSASEPRGHTRMLVCAPDLDRPAASGLLLGGDPTASMNLDTIVFGHVRVELPPLSTTMPANPGEACPLTLADCTRARPIRRWRRRQGFRYA